MALESQLLSNKEMLQTQLPSTLSSSSETKADAFGLMQQLDARKQVGPGFLDGTPCRRVEYRFLGSGLDVTAAPFASLADITRHTVPSFHNSATIPQVGAKRAYRQLVRNADAPQHSKMAVVF